MVPAAKKKRREISDDENSPSSSSNKRVKTEPTDDDSVAEPKDDDSVATVEPDEPCIKTLVMKDLWDEDEEVVEKALKQLANLSDNSDGSEEEKAAAKRKQEEVVKTGGYFAIVKAMLKYPTKVDIQKQGIYALANLSSNSSFEPDVADSIVSIDGAEVVIDAMKRFPNDSLLQQYACDLLDNLTYDNEDNAKHIVQKLDGSKMIVAAMKAFPDKVRVQKSGCSAIESISHFDLLVEDVIRAGCRTAATKAADEHPDNEDIQNFSRRAIKHLWKFKE